MIEFTTPAQYTIPYRVLSQYLATKERHVEVHATPQEIQQLNRRPMASNPPMA